MKRVLEILSFITVSYTCQAQSYINYVTGRYNVTIDDANGVYNCPSVLDLLPSNGYSIAVGEVDSCFVNNWVSSQPWDILVNADSSMTGCTACGTSTAAAVGKLYANDSIYLKVKVFGNNFQYRDFKGFKLYSTVTKADELSLPENALLLSPNPASDFIYIQSTQQSFTEKPVLYDISGNRVIADINYINSHSYKADVSGLANGVYFVFVQSSKGYLKKKIVMSR
ncbi:MAG TPA: T9SS type A sorting domain-containing protein [Bacteroidia bacterium]|nr:T9SS type A sorting domain-containing protein [Bacteroidia bacterium]